MNKLMLGALALGLLTLNAGVASAKIAKEEYKRMKDGIEAEYKSARASCGSLAGNAKDVCMAEAQGKRKVARAELDARDKNTNRAWQ